MEKTIPKSLNSQSDRGNCCRKVGRKTASPCTSTGTELRMRPGRTTRRKHCRSRSTETDSRISQEHLGAIGTAVVSENLNKIRKSKCPLCRILRLVISKDGDSERLAVVLLSDSGQIKEEPVQNSQQTNSSVRQLHKRTEKHLRNAFRSAKRCLSVLCRANLLTPQCLRFQDDTESCDVVR